jgi:hypothetical protein
MTPDECKRQIKKEYENLLQRNVRNAEVLIEARARAAARHNGIPEYWREYLPEAVKP